MDSFYDIDIYQMLSGHFFMHSEMGYYTSPYIATIALISIIVAMHKFKNTKFYDFFWLLIPLALIPVVGLMYSGLIIVGGSFSQVYMSNKKIFPRVLASFLIASSFLIIPLISMAPNLVALKAKNHFLEATKRALEREESILHGSIIDPQYSDFETASYPPFEGFNKIQTIQIKASKEIWEFFNPQSKNIEEKIWDKQTHVIRVESILKENGNTLPVAYCIYQEGRHVETRSLLGLVPEIEKTKALRDLCPQSSDVPTDKSLPVNVYIGDEPYKGLEEAEA